MKIKTMLSTLLAALLLFALVGCQNSAPSAASASTQTSADALPSYATIGDLYADQRVSHDQWGHDTEYYVEVFVKDGVSYRAIAALPEGLGDQLFELDWDDPEHDEKQAALLAPVAIERIENLTALIPPQEELDKLVGKTGKELLDDGWTTGSYNLDEMEFWMSKGPFTYSVIFDGKLEYSDDFDDYEAIQSLTVKSVTFSNIGDATNLDN